MLHRCAKDVIRVLSPHVEPKRLQRYDQVLSLRTSKVSLVLENIFDPGNAAACLRTAEAYGIQNIHIIENYEKFQHVSAVDRGTSRWLDMIKHRNTMDAVETLRRQNHSIWASALTPKSVPLEQVLSESTSDEKIAIVFGNEARGTSKLFQTSARRIFQIPMVGFVESFNLSVAVGITLQACRTHNKLIANLSESEIDELKAKWLLADVLHSKHILSRHKIELDDY